MSEQFTFILRPSGIHFLVKLGLLTVLILLAMQRLSTLWVLLLVALLLLLHFFFRVKPAIASLILLAGDEWSVVLQGSSQLNRYQLVSIQILGCFCFLKFFDQIQAKQQCYCILSDQVSLQHWKSLQRLARFTPTKM